MYDEIACNYSEYSQEDDGSCIYFIDCNGICGGQNIEDECGNCYNPDLIIEGEFEDVTFNYTGDIQSYIVPEGITTLYIEAYGAEGGDSWYGVGGLGAFISSTVSVNPGETLSILVGEEGNGDSNGAGGGGGSFVVNSNNEPILIAGGGGGAGGYSETSPGWMQDGKPGVTTENGTDSQPSDGEYFIDDGYGGPSECRNKWNIS